MLIIEPGQEAYLDIFLIFFDMKVCCMFSLESPHRGDSNEYTQYTIFSTYKKISLNCSKSAATRFFSKGLKDEFQTALVNEPSVFEPLKFYCSYSFQFYNLSYNSHYSYMNSFFSIPL